MSNSQIVGIWNPDFQGGDKSGLQSISIQIYPDSQMGLFTFFIINIKPIFEKPDF